MKADGLKEGILENAGHEHTKRWEIWSYEREDIPGF